MIYTRPLATTGVDCPGKSAIQSGCCGSTVSGKPVSSEVPFCCGPRQLNQPWTGSARRGEARSMAASRRHNHPAAYDCGLRIADCGLAALGSDIGSRTRETLDI